MTQGPKIYYTIVASKQWLRERRKKQIYNKKLKRRRVDNGMYRSLVPVIGDLLLSAEREMTFLFEQSDCKIQCWLQVFEDAILSCAPNGVQGDEDHSSYTLQINLVSTHRQGFLKVGN